MATTKGALAPKRRPYLITMAVTGISEGRLLPGLAATPRQVMGILVAHASARDAATPIYVGKDTMATALGVSVRTVHRAIDALEAGGYVVRLWQSRWGKNGRFRNGSVGLTAVSCDALGLAHGDCARPDPDPDTGSSDGGSGPAAATVPECHHVTPPVVNPPLAVQKPQQTGQSLTQPPRPPVRSRSLRTLDGPVVSELAWLATTAKLAPRRIFWLMGKARDQGTTLSTVLAVLRFDAASTKLQGKRLFAYLRTCLEQERDWDRILRQREGRMQQVAEKTAAAAAGDAFRAQAGNTWWRLPDGRLVRVLAEGGGHLGEAYVEQASGLGFEGMLPITPAFVAAVAAGRIQRQEPPCNA